MENIAGLIWTNTLPGPVDSQAETSAFDACLAEGFWVRRLDRSHSGHQSFAQG